MCKDGKAKLPKDESDKDMPAAAAAVSTDEVNSQNLVAILRDYSDIYLDCRGIQHRWNTTKDLHIAEKREDGDLVERHAECENCETLRIQRFLLRQDRWAVHRLEVLSSTYKYPEGYLMSEMGMTDSPRELLRYEQFLRALNKPKTGKRPAKKSTTKIAVRQAAS